MYLSVIGVVGTFMALNYFNKKYKTNVIKPELVTPDNLNLDSVVLAS
jgi:hypothetical protein